MRRGTAELPLHGGAAPPWLFKRMKKLAGAITMAVVDEYGPEEMLRRLADPWWFQAFGCVLGFDWHSSGLTTVTCGAMKEAARELGKDLGIFVAGGKGSTSRRTPQEIAETADRHALPAAGRLIHASRLAAKVDSAAVQDGFQLYHHSFFFAPSGAWCVVQQGMNPASRSARRYHWLGETVRDFVCEPHNAISTLTGEAQQSAAVAGAGAAGRQSRPALLNMVAVEAEANRRASAELVRSEPELLLKELARATEGPPLFAPTHHAVLPADVNIPRLRRIIRAAHEQHPQDFQTLLGSAGVGPATIRSLALLAELIYDAPASRRDPTQPPPEPYRRGHRRWADYSYAHGGKDGHPFPVDRATYDRSIQVLTEAVRKARLGQTDKTDALKRLAALDRPA